MDWENARYLMVEQQIRPWDVLDQNVLQLLFEVKREDFLPASQRALALVDTELPLENGSKTWSPKLEARAVQEAKLTGGERVLLIGAGSGYLAALLGKIAKHVYVVEQDAALAEAAGERLITAGIRNVSIEVGDAVRGWSKHSPYDVIMASASYLTKPEFLFEQLHDGGRVFAIVGEAPAMTAMRYIKTGTAIQATALFETVVPAFPNAPQPERFHF
jgi:protein-L-isoaspartate(D-aspartate) O-methyltransferase